MQSRPRRPLVRSAVLALGLLVAVLSTPALAGATVEPGVATDLSWGISNSDKQQSSIAMRDAGVRWARITVGWRGLEPNKGSYSSVWFADLDAAVQAARDAGAKVILDVLESPQWASGSTEKYAPPRDPQDYADFVRYVVSRYEGQVDAYEIWNEQNHARFWTTGPNAAQYVALLKASYAAVKSVDPSASVVFGGLAWNDYHYVEAAYAAGAKGYFDAMAVHPYSCGPPDEYWWADQNENWLAGEGPKPRADARLSKYNYPAYREVRASMLAAGDDKPIWFTEFGWSSAAVGPCTVDEQTQATHLTRSLQIANQDPYVQMALWYNLREDYWGDPKTDWDSGFGLIRKDFTPKPAYYAFRDYATGVSSGSGTTTTGGTSGTTTTGGMTTGGTTSGEGTTTTDTSSSGSTTTTKKRKKRRARASAKRLSARRG
jgi:Cellulase (glycosyl hydrolase family 5)